MPHQATLGLARAIALGLPGTGTGSAPTTLLGAAATLPPILQAGADTLATVRYALVAALIAVGSFFLLVGTVGLLRFPNVYNRLHATSKATTLGAASIFLAGFVYFGPQGAGLVSLVGIAFLFTTAPTGAHMISRAAGKMGVPFEEGVVWPREASGQSADRDVGGHEDREDAADD